MAKWANQKFYEQGFDYIKNNVATMLICTAQPTDRANALALALADVAMAAVDVTYAPGDISGRKAVIGNKNAVPVDVSGTGNHIALISGTELQYVTTFPTTILWFGGVVNILSWDIEIVAPA